MRCRSCAFWPMRALRRRSNSLRSLSIGGDGIGIVHARQQIGREGDIRCAVALAFEPRLPRGQFVEPFGDDRKVGARDRIVEAHDHVAGLDAVAVARTQFADDAAGRMLDFLHVGIDDHRARRNERAGQLHSARPAADATDQDSHDDKAGQRVAGEWNGATGKPGYS